MKSDTSVLPPATVFPVPTVPSLSDLTQRFWEQLLGGLVNPQAGGDGSRAEPTVGGKPWR